MILKALFVTGVMMFSTLALASDEEPPVEAADAVADEAEDEADDELQDILNGGRQETVEDEKRAVREGDLDDRVGIRSETIILPEDAAAKRRLIKVNQRKAFLKLRRWELSLPRLGFVTNDPFINRYLVGVGVGYHLTEVFSIEFDGTYSPDFGKADWKPITIQLVEKNKVSPDISKIAYYGNVNFAFSPIYGKMAVFGRNIIMFDVFGAFGTGFVHTVDDLEALQATEDDDAIATQAQYHPTTNFGGGFRIIFNRSVAFRLEGRSMIYIETINSTTLEMKNNFMLVASGSIFLPGVK